MKVGTLMIPHSMMIQKWSKIISNKCDPKVVDDPQVFKDPKLISDRISDRNMDFDNPKVNSKTSIFDGLVFCCCRWSPSLT